MLRVYTELSFRLKQGMIYNGPPIPARSCLLLDFLFERTTRTDQMPVVPIAMIVRISYSWTSFADISQCLLVEVGESSCVDTNYASASTFLYHIGSFTYPRFRLYS